MFFGRKKKKNQKGFPKGSLENNHGRGEEITFPDLETVVNHFTDGLLVFSRDSNLVLMNPQAEKIFEVKKERVLVKHIFRLNSFPNFRPLVSLLGGGIMEISKKEVQIKKKVLEVFSIPMMVEKEKVGSLIVLHDITREKLVETMKTEFITLSAHQLRTPTSAIKWSLRMNTYD